MSVNSNPATPRCYCLALRQAARRVTQFYDHALAPAGLRGTQLPILSSLSEGEGMSVKALAALLVMDRATLGHNLRPLEAQGLVRLTVGADRRSRTVVLTEAGRARLRQAGALWKDAQRRFEAAFGAEEAAALQGLLGRAAHTAYEA